MFCQQQIHSQLLLEKGADVKLKWSVRTPTPSSMRRVKPNSLSSQFKGSPTEFAVFKSIPASVDTRGIITREDLLWFGFTWRLKSYCWRCNEALNRFYLRNRQTRLTLDGDWDNEAG
ncbi:hypothetical protein FOXG_16764 [Fusarium oxysporum f. sp. lycopersici 4287]|uniref:Uncharacterized protein n=2 Tax=Fusarium oxysporum TaxID=5507 RepID=A0A0J9W871_FUSO4|nr:hypothetical protein FOXG_16699 [Fusarium oxysporum f. sp. lycopersici 4287]XP_018257545.1 hypothetical protein FOXG_16764 [Fusarium oxysporum f. sp. lycopersici 4287]KNB19414.1 hypothetical protein FOXG_16699 [Fusarium oxysporum f. sp. lycopersici 4287]KNB19500.1 hypothetical protein FOXG_16764 [Fusarium oxysporum f. sp. lycopersici 4287]